MRCDMAVNQPKKKAILSREARSLYERSVGRQQVLRGGRGERRERHGGQQRLRVGHPVARRAGHVGERRQHQNAQRACRRQQRRRVQGGIEALCTP